MVRHERSTCGNIGTEQSPSRSCSSDRLRLLTGSTGPRRSLALGWPSWKALDVATKHILRDWIFEALRAHGGAAGPVDVCKYIWSHFEEELRDSGDLFYTWQYDVRWEAQKLRDKGLLAKAHGDRRKPWRIE